MVVFLELFIADHLSFGFSHVVPFLGEKKRLTFGVQVPKGRFPQAQLALRTKVPAAIACWRSPTGASEDSSALRGSGSAHVLFVNRVIFPTGNHEGME